jgi:hypothetical protein
MTSFVRFLDINVELTPNSTTGNTTKQVLLLGQRLTDSGTFYPTTNGFTQPNFYEPIQLPSFPSGGAALQYLGNYGLKYTLGINFTETYPAPTAVVSVNGLTTLTWSSVPNNFSQLTDFNLTGSLAQTSPSSVSGNVYSAAIIAGVATMVLYGIVAIATAGSSGGTLTLTGLNNVDYPDPVATDPICLMAWDFYQSALSAFASPFGAPSAFISILDDRTSTINPVDTAIVLGDPSAVTTGTTSTLTFASDTAGVGYLPTTTLGNSIVTQATSDATGVYAGYVISGSNIIITVTGVTGGTFVTGDSVSIALDDAVNAFDYLVGTNLYASVLQFPIATSGNITSQDSFFNAITAYNEANTVLNNWYLNYGIAGNITVLPNAASGLPTPNTQENILVTYPYIAKFGDIPYDNAAGTVGGGRVASAVAYMLANGDTPFPPLMTATINHLPVSSVASTTSYSAAQNGTGDIAVNQGWLPLAPNNLGVVTFLESNTTLITIPNTTTPDIEFRYTHIWDCVRWVKYQVAQLYNTISVLPFNQGSALISPAFTRQFTQGIIGILNQGQLLGVVQNVALYENLVSVVEDTQNPNQVDAYIPCQMIPQLNGANVLINVFSALYTFPNSQGA